MHRTALCLRTYRGPRLGKILDSRHSQRRFKAGATYQLDDDENPRESPTSWEDHHAREVRQKAVDAQDVVIGDLSATLEAHRASNRTSVIRKIDAPSAMPGLFLRPSIHARYERESAPSEELTDGTALVKDCLKSGVNGDQGEQTQEVTTAGRRIWPADSLQAQVGYGRRGRRRGRMRGRKKVRRTAGDDFVKSSGILEYTGVPFLPLKSWEYGRSSTPLFQRPWLAYMEGGNGDHLERLSCEIRAYEAYMRLTPAEEAAAQLVISDVQSVTRQSLRKAPLTMLGSRSTGLATPLSDFDLTFSIASPDNGTGKREPRVGSRLLIRQAVGSLREVEKDLRNSIKVQDTELVIARIPIIGTRHRGTGLKVQIQTMAPHQPAQEYSAAYLNELPSLRPLFIVLRYCLEIRGLTTVYEGGLGSYSLLMMIVNALKHSNGKFTSDDLAGQLLYVLHFYGSADLYHYGFSANPPRVFDKLKEKWSKPERLARSLDPQLRGIDEIVRDQNRRKPFLLSLQDPANDSNDLGKNSYAIKHVQAVFNEARQSILNILEQGVVQPKDHGKDEMWSYLDHLVRADYQSFEANRTRVERFAKDPLSKDYDYSAERITEDFQRRVQVYKGPITADGYGVSSNLPTQRSDRHKHQGTLIRRPFIQLAPEADIGSAKHLRLYLHTESVTTIRTLWLEWYDIKKRLAEIATPEAQATPIRIKGIEMIKIRRIDGKRTAAEMAHAQKIKHLTPSTAKLEKRFQVLQARIKILRGERNRIAVEVASSGHRSLTTRSARRRFNRDRGARELVEALQKDENVKLTSTFILNWYRMLRRQFHDLQREYLYVTRRLANLNGEGSGVADMQSRYERLRHVKLDYWREFVNITKRLASLNGQKSAIADQKTL